MTRQEAIERLNCLNNKCDPYECPDTECHKCDEAVEMAIEALEQEQPEIIRCKNCRHDNNCEIQYSAQAGSKFFCGLAERRAEQ